MVNGPTGRPGHNAVSRVAVEHKVGPDSAPIPHHNMEAKTAVETAKMSVLAMKTRAQVNKFSKVVHFEN